MGLGGPSCQQFQDSRGRDQATAATLLSVALAGQRSILSLRCHIPASSSTAAGSSRGPSASAPPSLLVPLLGPRTLGLSPHTGLLLSTLSGLPGCSPAALHPYMSLGQTRRCPCAPPQPPLRRWALSSRPSLSLPWAMPSPPPLDDLGH